VSGIVVLPDPDNGPPLLGEPLVCFTVALTVAAYFVSPEGGVGLGDGVVLWAAVPEATIQEDCNARLSKN
jgi:hypothetical protein